MRGVPITKRPTIIARRAGLQVEAKPAECGTIYGVQDQAGAYLYRSQRKESALAWIEGFAVGKSQTPT